MKDKIPVFVSYSMVIAIIALLTAVTLLTGCGTLKQVCYDVLQSKRCL